MIKPSSEDIRVISSVARQHPHFLEWLGEWRKRELEQLPYVTNQALTVAQGRCQVLTELVKLLNDSPNLAAQLRGSS